MTLRLWVGLLVLALTACAPAPLPDADVQAFVKDYIAATNAGDATKLMSVVSKDKGVASISHGRVTRGWDSIRTATDAIITSPKQAKVAVGNIDVVSLGPDTSLALASIKISVPSPFPMGPTQLTADYQGAMTIVVRRTPEGLRLLHEHYSGRGI